jgi:hypothetical protein
MSENIITRNDEDRPEVEPVAAEEEKHREELSRPKVNTVNPNGPASFTTWLRRQRHRSGPVGSLATDMAGDGGWPEFGSLQDYVDYLDGFSAPYMVLHALDVAWFEWVTERVV